MVLYLTEEFMLTSKHLDAELILLNKILLLLSNTTKLLPYLNLKLYWDYLSIFLRLCNFATVKCKAKV